MNSEKIEGIVASILAVGRMMVAEQECEADISIYFN